MATTYTDTAVPAAAAGEDSGVTLPNSITQKLGLYGVTPVTQRAGAAQGTALVGTASSTDVTTDLKAAVIEIMNTLTALGAWKGAA